MNRKRFCVERGTDGGIIGIKTSMKGVNVLENRWLNKGSGFSEDERKFLELEGLIPGNVESLEDQVKDVYKKFKCQPDDLSKYVFLHYIYRNNATLFFNFIQRNCEECLRIIYTPTVADAIKNYSNILGDTKGLFLDYSKKTKINSELDKYIDKNIKMVVITDSSGILGIGDQGVGGIQICVGKAALYTLFAGIAPFSIVPVVLDVGTDNEKLLNDKNYLGWRHKRIVGKEYLDFVDCVVEGIKKRAPDIYIHWEDFSKNVARKVLFRYNCKVASFNDDMQGTGIVTVGALLSALKILKKDLINQRIVFFGAGTAATGIADHLVGVMRRLGLSSEDVVKRIWMIGKKGLLTDNSETITEFQKKYARSHKELETWSCRDSSFGNNGVQLLDVINNVKPTILIGCSTVGGAFDEEIVSSMFSHVDNPIIFPLSNPTENSEALPFDLVRWTKGKAVIATGSPFYPVEYEDRYYPIAQCNNALVFPGLGLGILASRASKVTDNMLYAACDALVEYNLNLNYEGICSEEGQFIPLLPNICSAARHLSIEIAKKVFRQALEDGVAGENFIGDDHSINRNIDNSIRKLSWNAKYYPYSEY